MIWECTMCHACESVCPVRVPIADAIIELRRYQLLTKGEIDTQLKQICTHMEKFDNPLGITRDHRATVIDDCNLNYLQPNTHVNYLLWVGCQNYLDPTMRKVIKTLVKSVELCGYSVAVLEEETCCGDTIRKIGDEFSFQARSYENMTAFNKYSFDKILTLCPHCFNVFKNEYPSFHTIPPVVHYTDMIDELLKNRPSKKVGVQKKKIYYHPPCYLSRMNSRNIPTDELMKKEGYDPVSLKFEKYENLCCGGGGGRMYAEEKPQNRISLKKMEMIESLNVEKIITSCPYCFSLFQDAVKDRGQDIEVNELLLELCGD